MPEHAGPDHADPVRHHEQRQGGAGSQEGRPQGQARLGHRQGEDGEVERIEGGGRQDACVRKRGKTQYAFNKMLKNAFSR